MADATRGTLVNPSGNVFDINGGTTAGGVNLFHSFSQFTVGTGDTANFNGPASIQNIISRVTGGTGSTIDGTVASSIAGANLYLVNPAGILFGPNASISVDGSFHATTAGFLGFQDGSKFFVDPASASSLSAAPVTSFGFLTASPGPITVDSTSIQSAPAGTISIVGGQITLGAADGSAPAYVLAPNGVDPGGNIIPSSIRIASVAAPGEGRLGANGTTDVSSFSKLGTVRLQGNSFIDGGNVVIRGGRVEFRDATVLPGAFSIFGQAPPPDGGVVDIAATDSIDIQGTALDPFFGAPTGVLVFAGMDPSLPAARVPDVKLAAPSINMSGPSGVTLNRFAEGAAGTVSLDADTVNISQGASVSLVNAFTGGGGLLRVTAREVLLDGTGSDSFTGFAAQAVLNPAYLSTSIDPALTFATSGSIEVNASEQLTLRGGAEISTDSRSFGPSGDISLAVGNTDIDASKVAAQSSFAGDSGNVSLTATGRVTLSGGSVVSAATFGGGNGGTVRVSAAQQISITGERSGIASQTTPLPAADLNAFAELFLGPGAGFADLATALGLAPDADMFAVLRALNDFGLTAIPADQLAPGDGGAIDLATPALAISGLNAAIDSSTASDGDAGNVNIQANTVNVGAGATIGSRTGIPDLATGQLFVGTGRAGNVNVTAASQVSVAGEGATISTDTRGVGDAGNVAITTDGLQLTAGGRVSSRSSAGRAGNVNISATGTATIAGTDTTVSTDTSGAGNAGNVEIGAYHLLLADGARVSSSSTGTGLAGDIRITLGDSLEINGGAIATEAITSDGGNITITAPRLVDLINGRITTSVGSGQGNGGNILIDPNFVVVGPNSQIIANAFGGAGGNIDIITDFLIVSADSTISASSVLGVDGFVRTTAPDSDVSAGLAVLPGTYLDAASKLQAGCGAARAGQSSLNQVGRGGLPADPGSYLSSPIDSQATQDSSAMYQSPYLEALADSALNCTL